MAASTMLYLDDFCESVETLPQDMKHYMSHLRSLDLRVKSKCRARGAWWFIN